MRSTIQIDTLGRVDAEMLPSGHERVRAEEFSSGNRTGGICSGSGWVG